jgi:hypothetical protein
MYLIQKLKGALMGKKRNGYGEVVSKKEAVEELSEKVVETVEVSKARTLKIGDTVMHPTFAEGRIIKFATIDKVIGDFGGSLRTVSIDDVVLPTVEEGVEDEPEE